MRGGGREVDDFGGPLPKPIVGRKMGGVSSSALMRRSVKITVGAQRGNSVVSAVVGTWGRRGGHRRDGSVSDPLKRGVVHVAPPLAGEVPALLDA